MRVSMIFEFPIDEANKETAGAVIEELIAKSKELQEEFNALPPYKNYGETQIWVDDAY